MKNLISVYAMVAVATSITVILHSCRKDQNSSPPSSVTKIELLTMSPWKRTALISHPAYDWNANGVADTDVLKIMFPCEKDNLDTFYANGIIETNEGATRCDPADPQTWSVTWILADNEGKLIFDGTDVYELLELTPTTLKYQSTFVENGVAYTHIETYGH